MTNLDKYFWDFNQKALREVKLVLKNTKDPRFIPRIVLLLSRCNDPKKVFALIPRDEFVRTWSAIKSHWSKVARRSEFRDWWQTIYEQLLEERGIKNARIPATKSFEMAKRIGAKLKEARINKGLNQKELAILTGIKQPDISKIEEGKKNFTIATLSRFCKILNISNIDTV